MSVAWFDSVTITVEVAFTTAPFAVTPTWTDISAYLMGMEIKPGGRQGGLDQFQAGTLALTLNGTDRRFDPLYASGAYNPNVLPRKKVRVSVTHNAITYRLFTGFVDGWPNVGEPSNTLGIVNVSATDGFKMLSRAKVPWTNNTVGDGDTVTARIGRLLNYAGWPAADRDIDTDSPTMEGMVEGGQSIMDELYVAANVDLGSIFIAGDGDFTYHGHRWQLGNNLTASYTFGEVSPELPYSDIVLTYDDVLVFNKAQASDVLSVAYAVSDAASITAYGESGRNLGQMMAENPNVIVNTLEFVVANYKDPKVRVVQLGVNPRDPKGTALLMFPAVLNAGPGARWTAKRRPQNVGTAITQDVIVESVSHSVGLDTWQTTATLSAAPVPTGGGDAYWRMGVGKWTTGSPSATWA